MMENLTLYDKPVRMRTMLKFTLPTMILMVFSSLYTVADGIVVSNYVGSLGLSAINIVYPLLNVTMAISLMLSTGSNAVIAKKLGEGKNEEANQFLSLVCLVTVAAVGLIVTVMMAFAEPLYIFWVPMRNCPLIVWSMAELSCLVLSLWHCSLYSRPSWLLRTGRTLPCG